MSIDFSTEQLQIRDSVERLCAGFPDEYWRQRDTDGEFPEDFCQAIADNGFMGIAMPEEYGGAGLGITEAAILMQPFPVRRGKRWCVIGQSLESSGLIR